ncbi:MAG TPA: hypothetical protein VEW04_10050 [Allosphingosinicella sp.]|nr:hypothetical protein [Allosphingosinicella sp.]
MKRPALALISAALLASCAGQVRDYVGPRAGIVAPQLLRFEVNQMQATCIGERLESQLAPRQMRMFARALEAVRQGYSNPARLTFPDVMWVANAMGDAAVPRALRQADAACGVSQALNYARETAEAQAARLRQAEQANAPRPANWLNLGAAPSGQAIAIDASTLVREGTLRTAWFRLADPGTAGPSDNVYLLRVDCAVRTINARARERRSAEGVVSEHVDYPDNPLPVEGGTVMEIAFLSLCTEGSARPNPG